MSPDAVLVHVDDQIVFANRAAARILGAPSAEELVGRQMTDFVPITGRARALERRNKVGIDGAVPLESLPLCRLDGSEFTTDMTGCQYTWDGAPAILTIMRDITERIESE